MPPLWIVTEHWAELPVLYGSFPLAIYFTYGNAHVSVLLSVHPTFSFPRCNHVSSLCLCLYSCPANRFRHKKEWMGVSWTQVDELGVCFTEWSKSDREKRVSHMNAYIWNLERRYWWTRFLFHASVLGMDWWVALDPHFSLPWNSSSAGLPPPVSSLFTENAQPVVRCFSLVAWLLWLFFKKLSSSPFIFRQQAFSLGGVNLQWCFYFITMDWFSAAHR